jgi:hypothetical protein
MCERESGKNHFGEEKSDTGGEKNIEEEEKSDKGEEKNE